MTIKIKKSRQDLARKEDKSRDQQEGWFSVVYQNGGLWSNHEDIDSSLQRLPQKESIAAVKAQINMGTKVLHVNGSRVPMKKDLNALWESVMKLMDMPVSGEFLALHNYSTNPLSLVSSTFVRRWKDDVRIEAWHSGITVDRGWTMSSYQNLWLIFARSDMKCQPYHSFDKRGIA